MWYNMVCWKSFVFFSSYFKEHPEKLLEVADAPLDAALWVQLGKLDELAEAELKYVGPLTRGSSAVFFGVELKVILNLGHLYLS